MTSAKKKNSMGYTPLAWAALNGHEEVVRILLERDDIDPDKPDEYDQTPLRWAASMGHERARHAEPFAY